MKISVEGDFGAEAEKKEEIEILQPNKEESKKEEPKKDDVKKNDSKKDEPSSRKTRKRINLKSVKLPKKSKNQKSTSDNPETKKGKDSKYFLPVVCAIATVIVIAIVIVSLITNKKVDDNYFVSDETKDVITLEVSEADAATTNLIRTHIVYTYNNDKISSLKTYYEYENNDEAQNALENTRSINPNAESVNTEDKYIIVVAKPDQYEKLTPSDIKQQAEAIRQFQASQKEAKQSKESKQEDSKETKSTEE